MACKVKIKQQQCIGALLLPHRNELCDYIYQVQGLLHEILLAKQAIPSVCTRYSEESQ